MCIDLGKASFLMRNAQRIILGTVGNNNVSQKGSALMIHAIHTFEYGKYKKEACTSNGLEWGQVKVRSKK